MPRLRWSDVLFFLFLLIPSLNLNFIRFFSFQSWTNKKKESRVVVSLLLFFFILASAGTRPEFISQLGWRQSNEKRGRVQVFLHFARFLPSFTDFYRVSPAFTGFYWVLPGFTEFHWVLPGFTGFYRVLLGLYGHYCVLLGLTKFFFPCSIKLRTDLMATHSTELDPHRFLWFDLIF